MRAYEVKNHAYGYEVKICVYEVKIRSYEVKSRAYKVTSLAQKSGHGCLARFLR